jgi:hypothetical protein
VGGCDGSNGSGTTGTYSIVVTGTSRSATVDNIDIDGTVLGTVLLAEIPNTCLGYEIVWLFGINQVSAFPARL